MRRFGRSLKSLKLQRGSYPVCPWCGQNNWEYGTVTVNGQYELQYYWDGPRRALWAGYLAKLWTKKGRIYGGTKKKGWGDPVAPVRVNERHWKIVRSGPRLLVACANPFHEDRSK